MTDGSDASNRGSALTYRAAGVDIDAGNALVRAIAPIARRTRRKEVLSGLGGFGSLFQLPTDRYREPVLVAGTDGVGTKLKIAQMTGQHDTIGIDLVAMCVNDIVVCGAEPLFFLDYFATGRLNVDQATAVVEGIARGCELAGAALVGGETAEMPGMYQGEDYDLAGFCVGVVERDAIIDGQLIQPGNHLIGLASSGVHANGYSLVRRILSDSGQTLDSLLDPTDPAGATLSKTLLEPTRIYVKPILDIAKTLPVLGLAHITGGGIAENIARVIPTHCDVHINVDRWSTPPIFNWLQAHGNITDAEMWRTFNCGLGMAVVVDAEKTEAMLNAFSTHHVKAFVIGEITDGDGTVHLAHRGSS